MHFSQAVCAADMFTGDRAAATGPYYDGNDMPGPRSLRVSKSRCCFNIVSAASPEMSDLHHSRYFEPHQLKRMNHESGCGLNGESTHGGAVSRPCRPMDGMEHAVNAWMITW